MKDHNTFSLERVIALSCSVTGSLRRPEHLSWDELGMPACSAVCPTSTARATVTASDGGTRRPVGSDDLESTQNLLDLTRGGDLAARDRLIARYLPALQAWAHGRVPRNLQGLTSTDDLVQETFVKAIHRMDRIEYLHEGGFFAYLRTVLRSKVVDMLRKKSTQLEGDSLPRHVATPGPSPFDEAVGREILEAYEAALEQLTEQQRAAVSLRVELGLTFKEVADAVGCPSANAARMLVSRGVVRLSEVMNDPR